MANSLTVRAYIKNIDQAPRKVSLVASLIRRRNVAQRRIFHQLSVLQSFGHRA